MKKRTNQTWFTPNLESRATNSRLQISDTVGTEIRQLAIFEVIPKPFIGIQVRSIGRKKLDLQPPAGLVKKRPNRFRAVNHGPIPENNHPVSKMPPQVFEKTKDFPGANAAVGQHQIQPSSTTDRRNGRKLGPRRAMSQNRGLALRGPRPDTGGMQ